MKTYYVIRPTGFNIGNHVIFAGLRKLFTQSTSTELNFISIPASGKYDRFGKPGLTAGSIHEINQYGHGVIVGGGNLFENGEIDVDIQALNALQVPLMIIGVSWGRIYDKFGNLVERTDSLPDSAMSALLRKASIVSVRERSSFEFAKQFRPDIYVDGCPSINIVPSDVRSKEDVNRILIPIRNPSLMNILPFHQNRVSRDIREIIDSVQALGYSPVLLCHDHRDISFASLFDNVEYKYEESVPAFLNLIRDSVATISYRLHASLPSIVLGKPTLNISYDERAESLMEYHECKSLNVNMLKESVLSKVEGFLSSLQQPWDLSVETKRSLNVSRELQNRLSQEFNAST